MDSVSVGEKDVLPDELRQRLLAEKFIPRHYVHLFVQRALRIDGWVENFETGDWSFPPSSIPVYPTTPGTDLVAQDDAHRALQETHGDRFLSPISPAARFSTGPGRHHRPFFEDYSVAEKLILQAVGDISEMEIWDNRVLCAIFCRPNVTPGGIYITTKEIKEDWWQHKAVMILKLGVSAFSGDESWKAAKWGDSHDPVVGDWLFAEPSAGVQTQIMGEGGSRPKGRDPRGQEMDIFEWDGWPCRIIRDDEFLGRLTKPHGVV